jgi:hypothetical protein
MREGRKPRRRAAVEPDAPQVETPGVAGSLAESLAEPVAAPEPAAADGLAPSQLSLHVYVAAAQAEVKDDEKQDYFDEPEDSVDLLVSVSNETLEGKDEAEEDESVEAREAKAADEAEPVEAAAEWVYPGPGATAAPETDGSGESKSVSESGPDQEPGEGRLESRTAEPTPVDHPALKIRLARIHLRTGSLFLARAELESLAAREQLDTAAHLDLAEARWRTGDLQGAGEAAAAYLADGGHEALGFVISAEAFALENRLDDARQHAAYALERHLSELDPVFAGMPRRAPWPASAWSSAEPETAAPARVSVAPPAVAAAPAPAAPAPEPEPVAIEPEPAAPAPDVEPTPEPPLVAEMPAAPETLAAPETPAARETLPVPGEAAAVAEVESGRGYLQSGDPMMAALHFGVAIRLAPITAIAVFEAIGDRRDLPLQLVRGDAQRLLGLEADAGSTYLSVASALGAGKTAVPEPAPEAVEERPTSPAAEPPAPASPANVPAARPAPDEPPALRWE